MSCASFFCMAPTHVPEEEVLATSNELESVKSLDPDGTKDGLLLAASPKSVTASVDREDRYGMEQDEPATNVSQRQVPSQEDSDPVEDERRANSTGPNPEEMDQDGKPKQVDAPTAADAGVVKLKRTDAPAKQMGQEIKSMNLDFPTFATDPKLKAALARPIPDADIKTLRKVTGENKLMMELMEENLRKDFHVTSLEAALQAHNRNPRVWNKLLQDEVAGLKKEYSANESSMVEKIRALEARVNSLEGQLEDEAEEAEKTRTEHEKQIIALNLLNERLEEESHKRMGRFNDDYQRRMKDADDQKSGLLETLNGRIDELSVAQQRIKDLENELKLRDLIKEVNVLNTDGETVCSAGGSLEPDEVMSKEVFGAEDQEEVKIINIESMNSMPSESGSCQETAVSVKIEKVPTSEEIEAERKQKADERKRRLDEAVQRLQKSAVQAGIDPNDEVQTNAILNEIMQRNNVATE